MVYLLLAILSSTAISVLMRFSTKKVRANASMLAISYLVCAVLSAFYADFQLFSPQAEGFAFTVVLGIASGAVYLGGFMMLQANTAKNGIVLTSVFMKLGLLVPIVLSVLCFGETPTWLQVVGFVIAVGAIILINLKKEPGSRFGIGLIALLLLSGSCDAAAKVFTLYGPAQLESQYLFYTFFVAFALCLIPVFANKERPGLPEILFGICIGIPNFFSSKFLLAALAELPAVVVCPSFSAGTLLLVTLTGVAVFREKLRIMQWIAVAAIFAALILLNI